MLKRVGKTLSAWLHRSSFEREMREEIDGHLQMRIDTLVQAGASQDAARRQARLEFGSREHYKDRVREVRMSSWFEQLRQDLGYGVRNLLRRPVFTATAVLTLALGVGATATVYALFDTLLLRPLAVPAPEELVHVYTSCRRGNPYCASSYPEYLDYRTQSRTLADLAVFAPVDLSVGAEGGNWVASGMLVSTNYFSLLGVTPHVGSLMAPGWDVEADPPTVLAHRVWLTRFGGDPDVVGTTIRLSGNTFRIIGVAPPGFRGTRLDARPDLWVAIDNVALTPMSGPPDMLARRDMRWIVGTVGRLLPGATLAQAQADLNLVSENLQAVDPTRAGRFVTVEAAERAALPPGAAQDITRFAVLLMGAVSAALLIACTNIAGLLLARGASRRRELELRRALGAGRGRLVRQLLTEFVPLAVAGTLGGLVVARGAMAFVAAYDPMPTPLPALGLDARVLAFALVLLVVTGLFGLVPALGSTRALTGTGSTRVTDEGSGSLRGQGALVGAQVAVTIVLLVGAGLFVRSLQNGLTLDVGLTSRAVVMARITPSLERIGPERVQAILDEGTSRLTSLPAVEQASAAMFPPLRTGNGFLAQELDGYVPAPDEEIRFESNFVLPGYFSVLGIDLRSGRDFTEVDRGGAPLVAVISETMARRYWADRDPIGDRIHSRSFPEPIEIVGVARNVTVGLDGTAEPFVYLPLRQHPRFLARPIPLVVFARTASDPAPLMAGVRRALLDLDAGLPITQVSTLEAEIAALLTPQRLGTALLSGLAGVAVVLVTVGVVGMVGYSVSRRRREIGVRLAMGAVRSQVAGTMTRGVLVPMAVGLIAGTAGALSLARLASAFLYGVAPTDLVTFGIALMVLASVAGVAAFVPAWRASGVNPTEVLHAD